MPAAYNKEKMKKLVVSDRYLKFVFNDLLERGNDDDTVLEVLFNENVDDDGIGDYRAAYYDLK